LEACRISLVFPRESGNRQLADSEERDDMKDMKWSREVGMLMDRGISKNF
jgi:hypothetical protein